MTKVTSVRRLVHQNRSDSFLPYGIAMKLRENLYDEVM